MIKRSDHVLRSLIRLFELIDVVIQILLVLLIPSRHFIYLELIVEILLRLLPNPDMPAIKEPDLAIDRHERSLHHQNIKFIASTHIIADLITLDQRFMVVILQVQLRRRIIHWLRPVQWIKLSVKFNYDGLAESCLKLDVRLDVLDLLPDAPVHLEEVLGEFVFVQRLGSAVFEAEEGHVFWGILFFVSP